MDGLIRTLLFYCSLTVQHLAESIDFRLDEPDLHRVVLPFEADVIMTCSASPGVANPQIEVRHQDIDVSDQQGMYLTSRIVNMLQVSIPRITVSHGGTYDCTVTGQGVPTETASLNLDVQDGGGAFCFHNSQSLNFTEGDHFRLLCFYPWFATANDVSPFDFRWQETSGLTTRNITDSTDIQIEDGVKGIVVGDVGPLEVSDKGNVYKCVHPTQFRSGSKVCEIGPINVKPGPTVAALLTSARQNIMSTSVPQMQTTESSTVLTNSKTISTSKEMLITETTNAMRESSVSKDTAMEATPTSSESRDQNGITPTVIILASVALASFIMFALIMVCLCYYCRSGKTAEKKTPEEKKEMDREVEIGHDMTDNPSYDGSESTVHPQPNSVWVTGGIRENKERNEEESESVDEPRIYDNRRRIIGDVKESYKKVNNNRGAGRSRRGTRRTSLDYDDAPTSARDPANDNTDRPRTSRESTSSQGGAPLPNVWSNYNTLRKSLKINVDKEDTLLY